MLIDPVSARLVPQAMRLIDDGSQLRLLLPLLESGDTATAKDAADTFKQYKVDPATLRAGAQPAGPLLGSMKTEAILDAIVKTRGDVARGEQLFTQQGCVACHTTKPEEPLKGPFLGAIAGVYQRRDLAENILLPSKSIAQGFATNHFVLENGIEVDGFVTTEAANEVSIRTITSQQMTFPKKQIKARSVSEKSLMPEGLVANLTVKDFASLLDYLESLVKK
jgi:putative heme-binding domain-containing protein